MSWDFRVTSIQLISGQVPVDVKFSFAAPSVFPFLIVRMSNDGLSGWGEGHFHDPAEAEALATQLLGLKPVDIDTRLDTTAIHNEASRRLAEAFSIAAHDLIAKKDGMALCDHFGVVKRRSVPLMPCLFVDDPDEAEARTRTFVNLGARSIKIKIFGHLDSDIALIEAVRRAAGADVVIQADANCGYIDTELRDDGLCSLREAGLDIIEDPCDGDAATYASLRSQRHPNIMIDVHARDIRKLRHWLKAGAADIVNLHPCQQGTMREVLKRAKVCELQSVDYMVGGTGFVGIGSAAYQHLAAVIGTNCPCGELGGGFDHGMPTRLTGSLVSRSLTAELQDTLGLGVEPDLEKLSCFVTHELTLTL